MNAEVYDGLVSQVKWLEEKCRTCQEQDFDRWQRRYLEAENKLREADRDEFEYFDKKERRRIDEERNHKMAELEEEKNKISKKNIGVNIGGKAFGLVIVGFGAWMTYCVELDGRLTHPLSKLYQATSNWIRDRW